MRRFSMLIALGASLSCSEADLKAAIGDGANLTPLSDGATNTDSAPTGDADDPGPGTDDDASQADVGGADIAVPADVPVEPDVSAVDDATASEDATASDDTAIEDATTEDTTTPDTTGQDAAAADTSADTTTVPPPPDPSVKGSVKYTTSSATVPLPGGVIIPKKLDLTLFVPNGQTGRPVVVLSHGFQLPPNLYTSTAEHLASWGYVVVVPDLGQSFTTTHVENKDKLITLLDWIETQASAASGPLAGVADTSRIVMVGHSMGGKLSFMVAAEDARPVAVFALDPVDSAGGPITLDPASYPSVTPEKMGDIDVPFMVVGETTNSTGGFGGQSCAPAADNFQQYYQHAESPVAQFEFVGAFHMSWLDDPACLFCLACEAGTADNDVVKSLTQRTLVAFLKVFVDSSPEYGAWIMGDAAKPDETAGLIKRQSKNGFPTGP